MLFRSTVVVLRFCLLIAQDRFVELSFLDFGFDTCIVTALIYIYIYIYKTRTDNEQEYQTELCVQTNMKWHIFGFYSPLCFPLNSLDSFFTADCLPKAKCQRKENMQEWTLCSPPLCAPTAIQNKRKMFAVLREGWTPPGSFLLSHPCGVLVQKSFTDCTGLGT